MLNLPQSRENFKWYRGIIMSEKFYEIVDNCVSLTHGFVWYL
ncbi:MAG: hypothetical protein CM1200mP40_30700 [Gammaproteobacteria bacterium]|nr:MAG: hypothetical protein CM1200mP40_30700 [Gammaproteobacteria bacterium]